MQNNKNIETLQNSCSEGVKKTKPSQTGYREPQVVFLGTVEQLVQSGCCGNRTETYQGSYWSDNSF